MAFRRKFSRRSKKYVKRRRTVRSRRSKYRRRAPLIRRSLFRSRGKIRRHNTGALNVNTIMRYGNSLPQTAFGACKLAVPSQQHILTGRVNNNEITAPGQYMNDGRRTLMLSTITNPYGWWQDTSLVQNIRCFGLYRLLYKRYIVLGAKVKIRLSSGLMPLRFRGVSMTHYALPVNGLPFGSPNLNIPGSTDLNNRTWDQTLNDGGFNPIPDTHQGNPYMNVNPNIYFYVRVCLTKFSANGTVEYDPDTAIGHRMLRTNTGGGVEWIDTSGEQTSVPWTSIVDFLGDKTVAYSRDRRTWNTSNGPVSSGFYDPITTTGSGVQSHFSGSFNARKQVTTLRYNYSLKKLTKDNNPLRDNSPFWRDIDQQRLTMYYTGGAPIADFPRQEFTLRYGCVWFDPDTGLPQFHYPYPVPFSAQTEINYYCAWRHPTNISLLNNPNLGNPGESLGAGAMELASALDERQRLMEKITNARLFQEEGALYSTLRTVEGDPNKEAAMASEVSSEDEGSESDYSEEEDEEEYLEPSSKRPRLQVLQPVPRQVE